LLVKVFTDVEKNDFYVRLVGYFTSIAGGTNHVAKDIFLAAIIHCQNTCYGQTIELVFEI